MQQLSGLDAAFVYSETPRAPMHIAQLMIYDPSTAPNGFVRFKDILRTFEERLQRSPMFRRRLVQVPLNLDHPYWVEDPDFDLEFHVRHIALPKPGDWRQLCIQIARLHSRPLDFSRPLWETYVIEGLDNVKGLPKGCFALYMKTHHACIDGTSGVEFINAIHDLTPLPPPEERKRERRAPDAAPSNLEVLWKAYMNTLRSPKRVAELIGEGIPAWKRLRDLEMSRKVRSLGEKERTRFNHAVSPNRVFGAVLFDLGEVRAIKSTFDSITVNDVLLTIVGGAMREYLSSKAELPEKSLVSGAPVNVRDDSEANTGGNAISMMSISLRSDIADPLERLQAVHAEAQASKMYLNAVGARLMTDVASKLPSQLTALGFRAAIRSGLMADMKPIYNTVVTNVPGAQIPLYMGGAKLVRGIGLGPIADGLGIIHPVGSYNGEVWIGFQACREMLPDPQFYEQCLIKSFEELRASALRAAPAKKPATKAKSKSKARPKTKAKAKARSKPRPKPKA